MASMEFDYKGNHYELGFSRRTAQAMEQAGFNIYEIDTRPLTRVPQLWEGAFMLHHKRTPKELRTEIYHKLKNRTDAIARLGELYLDTVATLVNDEEEEQEDFIDWE